MNYWELKTLAIKVKLQQTKRGVWFDPMGRTKSTWAQDSLARIDQGVISSEPCNELVGLQLLLLDLYRCQPTDTLYELLQEYDLTPE